MHSSQLADSTDVVPQDKSLKQEQDRSAVGKSLAVVEDKSVEALPAAVDNLQCDINNTTVYLANVSTYHYGKDTLLIQRHRNTTKIVTVKNA